MIDKQRYWILVSTLLCSIVARSNSYNNGRLFVPIMDTLKSTRAETSAFMSTYLAVHTCTGLTNGLLVKRYGPKMTGTLGTIVSGLAISACYFANSLAFLTVVQCILVAVGTSFIHIACLTMVKQHFEGKAQYIALSLVGIGPGVGAMMNTYVTEYLFYTYGLRGTFLISGALQLNAFSIMMGWPCESSKQKGPDKDPDVSCRILGALKSMCAVVTDKLVYSFVLVSIGIALLMTSQNIFIIFITDLMVEKNMDNYLASLTIFLFVMWSILGRLIPGFVKLIPNCPAMIMPVIAAVMATLANASIVFTETEYGVIMCCSLSGIAFGMATGLANIVPLKLLEDDLYAAGVGFILSISGFALLIAGPINGFIKDTTGSYTSVYLMATAFSGFGGTLLLVTELIRRKIHRQVAVIT